MEGCSMHCRIFSSIPGHYSLDASSTSPVTITKYIFRHFQMSLRGKIDPRWEPRSKIMNRISPPTSALSWNNWWSHLNKAIVYNWWLRKEGLCLRGMMPSKLQVAIEFCSTGKAGPGMKFTNRTEWWQSQRPHVETDLPLDILVIWAQQISFFLLKELS